ncbi:hypothetical protein SK128_027296 [Halocaridina rubra]|uniref:Uncharacterized protein n=1 Tax=Halocaridina rubra TaxID=373956 RepID=A0AAN8WPR2_HALRR
MKRRQASTVSGYQGPSQLKKMPNSEQETRYPVSHRSLRITTIFLGAFGFFWWANGIGFSLGYCFYSLTFLQANFLPVFGVAIYIPVNIAYIYFVSRYIFCITAKSFPDPEGLRDARQNVARLVAAAIVGMAQFVTAVVWFSITETTEFKDKAPYAALFGCSFSFIWAYLVAIFAGVHETKCSRLVYAKRTASSYNNRQSVTADEIPVPPKDYYNYKSPYFPQRNA